MKTKLSKKQKKIKKLLRVIAHLRGMCYHTTFMIQATEENQTTIDNNLRLLKTKQFGAGLTWED